MLTDQDVSPHPSRRRQDSDTNDIHADRVPGRLLLVSCLCVDSFPSCSPRKFRHTQLPSGVAVLSTVCLCLCVATGAQRDTYTAAA